MRRDQLVGPPDDVARSLLGAIVVAGDVTVRLTEVEAYGGADDPASHAFCGQTARNRAMFGPPGHLYVYLIYGMHHCANVVCGEAGDPAAVLLRAATVCEGESLVRARRGSASARRLADGPGRLCQALGIDWRHDGADLLDPRSAVRLEAGPIGAGESIVASARVGISKEVARPWRFELVAQGTGSARTAPR